MLKNRANRGLMLIFCNWCKSERGDWIGYAESANKGGDKGLFGGERGRRFLFVDRLRIPISSLALCLSLWLFNGLNI